MNEIFADLHVHIGRSENGKPIKITAARSLNFANIAKECADRKGINVVGIIPHGYGNLKVRIFIRISAIIILLPVMYMNMMSIKT